MYVCIIILINVACTNINAGKKIIWGEGGGGALVDYPCKAFCNGCCCVLSSSSVVLDRLIHLAFRVFLQLPLFSFADIHFILSPFSLSLHLPPRFHCCHSFVFILLFIPFFHYVHFLYPGLPFFLLSLCLFPLAPPISPSSICIFVSFLASLPFICSI